MNEHHKEVLKCLKLIVEHGSYEAGAISAYDAIKDYFNIPISFDEMDEILNNEGTEPNSVVEEYYV